MALRLSGWFALWLAASAQAALPDRVSGEPLPTLAPVLERAAPAVVNIAAQGETAERNNPLLQDPFFRRFFGIPDRPRLRRTQSVGSGVIVDAEQGYVLTNHHVIAQAREISVTLLDGREFQASRIGSDPDTDIALIRIPAKALSALSMADSDRLRVGDFVVAIGNPFGLGQTVTSGIVSALGRSGLGIEGMEHFIQTDASINPGNSGGALIDLRGELVGINTAILAPGGGSVGIGFAIPANMARTVMRQLAEHGSVQRGSLGVTAQDLTSDLARAFGLDPQQGGGVIIDVAPGSAAARAGLQVGDVVIAIGGQPVRNAGAARTRIGLLALGERIALDVVRQGKPLTISAVIEAPVLPRLDASRLHPRLAGAVLSELSPDTAARDDAAVVFESVQSDSPAWHLGLRDGDRLIALNRRTVQSLREIESIESIVSGQRLLLHLRRNRSSLSLLID